MAKVKIISERDLEVFTKNITNKATGKQISFEWQWLPNERTAQVRFNGKGWTVLGNDCYECWEKSKAYHLACWHVRHLTTNQIEEVLNV